MGFSSILVVNFSVGGSLVSSLLESIKLLLENFKYGLSLKSTRIAAIFIVSISAGSVSPLKIFSIGLNMQLSNLLKIKSFFNKHFNYVI